MRTNNAEYSIIGKQRLEQTHTLSIGERQTHDALFIPHSLLTFAEASRKRTQLYFRGRIDTVLVTV